jgi:hypothetical protein
VPELPYEYLPGFFFSSSTKPLKSLVGDRLEVLDRIVRQVVGTARRIDGHGGDGGDRQRIAIRRRARGFGRADGATGAALVLDHHGLAEFLAHALRHEARDDVGGAAGRERNDDADRLVGVLVGGMRSRSADRAGGQCDGDSQGANFHHWCVSSKCASPSVNGPSCGAPVCGRDSS